MTRGLTLPELGPIPRPRARFIRLVAGSATVAVCAWVLAYPRPYWVAICSAYVALAVMTVAPLAAKDEFRLREPRQNPPDRTRFNLTVPLTSISAVLMMRAVLDLNTVDVAKAATFGLLGSLMYALLVWVIVPRASFGIAALIGLLLGPAAVLHLNAVTLSDSGYLERGVVTGKYASTKPYRHIVVVAIGANRVELPTHKGSFSSYAVGQPICTEVRVGALGIGARDFRPC